MWYCLNCSVLVRPNLKHYTSSALSAPGLPISGKTWEIGKSPLESHQDDQRVGELYVGRKVAGIGCIQPRQETVLQCLKSSHRADGGTLFTRMPSDKGQRAQAASG